MPVTFATLSASVRYLPRPGAASKLPPGGVNLLKIKNAMKEGSERIGFSASVRKYLFLECRLLLCPPSEDLNVDHRFPDPFLPVKTIKVHRVPLVLSALRVEQKRVDRIRLPNYNVVAVDVAPTSTEKALKCMQFFFFEP
mmetsp:Transcript_38495/g.73974  ORF Transcript_38495/g.73974 Transcript_38495/m.73974 type:complete len:140 (+) Transcript_38495:392-811(+)